MNFFKHCLLRQLLICTGYLAMASCFVVTSSSADESEFPYVEETLVQLTDALERSEWSIGYYSGELLEPLQQLADAQLAVNRLNDAEATIDRAAQIARIEYGLYAKEQYPFLQQAIDIEMTRGDWDEVVDKIKHFTWLIGKQYEGDASSRLRHLVWIADVHHRGFFEDSREREAYHLIRRTTLREVAVQYAQVIRMADDFYYADLLLALANSYGMESAAIRDGGRTGYRLRLLIPGTDVLDEKEQALEKRYAVGLEKLEMRRDVIASIDNAGYSAVLAAEDDILRWQVDFGKLDPEDYASRQAGDD